MKDYINIKFDLSKNPTTAQQKGESIIHGRIHHYEKENVSACRHEYETKLRQSLTAQGIQPPRVVALKSGRPIFDEFLTEQPVALMVDFYIQVKDKNKWGQFCAAENRGDLDNLEKLLLDAMTNIGIWKDDSRVVLKMSRKKWAEHPSVEITIQEART